MANGGVTRSTLGCRTAPATAPARTKRKGARGALQAAVANSRASRGKALIPVRRRVTVLPAMSRENISSRNSARVVDGGGKRGQNSGGLVTFHSAPFPLGRGVLSERPAAVKGAPVLRGEANPSRRGPF